MDENATIINYAYCYRNSTSIELTFTDGIRPGMSYTICVAAQTSPLNSSKVASSVKSCIFLVTGKPPYLLMFYSLYDLTVLLTLLKFL